MNELELDRDEQVHPRLAAAEPDDEVDGVVGEDAEDEADDDDDFEEDDADSEDEDDSEDDGLVAPGAPE